MITSQQLATIMPYSTPVNRERFIQPLNDAMAEFRINTPARISAFLAQIAHESGSLRYVKEIASGEAYEGRKDLGNTRPGDGTLYKGRGLIQVTGKANYTECGKALGVNLLDNPELLEHPINACRSAAWFWNVHGLNDLADVGLFGKITQRINGGFNGAKERLAIYAVAKKVLMA